MHTLNKKVHARKRSEQDFNPGPCDLQLSYKTKSKVNCEKNELGKFIDKMKCLVSDQQQETEYRIEGFYRG